MHTVICDYWILVIYKFLMIILKFLKLFHSWSILTYQIFRILMKLEIRVLFFPRNQVAHNLYLLFHPTWHAKSYFHSSIVLAFTCGTWWELHARLITIELFANCLTRSYKRRHARNLEFEEWQSPNPKSSERRLVLLCTIHYYQRQNIFYAINNRTKNSL